jgi:hypothetical protein
MEEYTPVIHKCLKCNEYNHILRVRERRLRERAIVEETDRINKAKIDKRKVCVAYKSAIAENAQNIKDAGIVPTKNNTVSSLLPTNRSSKPDTRDIGLQSMVLKINLEEAVAKCVNCCCFCRYHLCRVRKVGFLNSSSFEVMNESFVKIDYDFYNSPFCIVRTCL